MGQLTTFALDALVIARPAMQSGLTPIIPVGEVPIHYINRYRADEDVRCAFCDNHTPHKRGFTAQMADGRIALCGRDCAAKYFGQEVADRFEAALEAQIERASRRRLVERAVNGVPATLAALTQELIAIETQAAQAVRALTGVLGSIEFDTRVTDAGALEVVETTRRWVEREDENGQLRRAPVDESRVRLRIAAATLLLNPHRLGFHFEAARKELTLLAGVTNPDGWSEQVIDRMALKRTKIISELRTGCRLLQQCGQLLAPANIEALSQYAGLSTGRVERVSLHNTKGGGELVVHIGNPYTLSVSNEARRYRLPALDQVPEVDTLLAALREG